MVGFESSKGLSGGGIQATGNYLGRARSPDEIHSNLEFPYSKIPGLHRLNLHAMYLDCETNPDRDEMKFSHFLSWANWAKTFLKLKWNPNQKWMRQYFSPLAEDLVPFIFHNMYICSLTHSPRMGLSAWLI